VKRLVQEVRNVEAPLSPSSDCHNDIKPFTLCDDAQPSSVPASECSTLLVANCQSADVPVPPLRDVSDNAGVSLADTIAVSSSAPVTVMSSLGTHELSSETCCTLVSHQNVADSDADEKHIISASDTIPSSSCDALPASETQLPCVGNADTVTPGDSLTLDS